MDGLRSICNREGVSLSYKPLDPDRGLLGMYIRDGDKKGIILDESLLTQPRMERSVLAEEVGHHKTTGAGTIFVVRYSFNVAVTIKKTEERALRWATDYLIPTKELIMAVRSGRISLEDLADFFYVAPWVVRYKFQFLRQVLRKDLLHDVFKLGSLWDVC